MVDTQDRHDAMRHLPRESWFRWKCDDPREIESWGANLRLAASKTFLDADRDLLDRVPLLLRLAARYAPVLLRGQASSYRLNLARVRAARGPGPTAAGQRPNSLIPYTAAGGFPGFDALIANAGRSALRGVEGESEYYVTGALNLFVSLGVTDSEFIDFVLDGTDLAGRAFPQSPAWNGALGLGWRDPRGWLASGTFSYPDDAYTEIAAPVFTQVSSRRLLGGRVGYERSGWSVYLWGKNLLDDQYELALFDGRLFGLGGVYGRMADPRAAGAGVDFDR